MPLLISIGFFPILDISFYLVYQILNNNSPPTFFFIASLPVISPILVDRTTVFACPCFLAISSDPMYTLRDGLEISVMSVTVGLLR